MNGNFIFFMKKLKWFQFERRRVHAVSSLIFPIH